LSADKNRTVYYNSMRVPLPEAINNVRAKLATTPDLKVLIHADKDLTYNEVDNVFDMLKESGALSISLVTQTSAGGGGK
jgi:biopolymer transport protein ExbD